MKTDKKNPQYEKADQYKKLTKLLQQTRYHGGSLYSKTLLSISLAGAPSVPYSTLANVLPVLFMGTHLADAEIHMDPKFDGDKYVTAFPSDKFMREAVYDTATMCTISATEFFAGKPVFIATDKGKYR